MSKEYLLLKKRHGPILLCVLSAAVLIYSGCETQPAPKTYRIGILNGFTPFSGIADGFKAKMTELGYLEGKNITYDVHEVDVDPTEQQRVLSQIVADKVDLIFVFPTGPAILAKAATLGTDIPVVFAMGSFEGTGLIENVRRPGGNITGVRTPGPEVVVKRFELLCELVPQAKRIYAIYNPNYPANQPALEALRPAASSLDVTLVEVPVNTLEDIQADLEARTASGDIGVDAVLIMPDDLSQSPAGWPPIARFAQQHKLSISGGASYEAEAGAVFSYIPDYVESGKLAAAMAHKIFRGTPAGNIPVATPVETLILNYRQAQELGLTVPEELLNLATKIIR